MNIRWLISGCQLLVGLWVLRTTIALSFEPWILPEGLQQLVDNDQLAEATYRSQIKCQGTIPYDLFSFPERILRGLDPSQVYPTVRQLCAISVLGQFRPNSVERERGTYMEENGGAYCGYKSQPGRTPWVLFNTRLHQRDGNEVHFWMEVVLFCESRCQCLSQAQAILPDDINGEIPTREAYLNELDNTENWDLNAVRPRYSQGAETDIQILFSPEMNYHTNDIIQVYRGRFRAPSSYERPVCKGPFPTNLLPTHFRRGHFLNIQSLCASEWFGGSIFGNAAAVCSRLYQNIGFIETMAHPAFSNTARSPTAPSSNYAAAIKMICGVRCRCPTQKPNEVIRQDLPNGRIFIWTPDFSNGGVVLHRTEANGNVVTSIIIPPQTGVREDRGYYSEPIQAMCSPDSDSICKSDPNVDLLTFETYPIIHVAPLPFSIRPVKIHLGPEMHNRESGLIDKPKSISSQPTCGGECHSAQDCSTKTPRDCRCIVNLEYDMAHTPILGSLTKSLCLPLSMIATSVVTKQSGRFGKRNEEDNPFCRCNSTYFSQRCCESPSGLVWENADLKMADLI